MLDKLLRIGRIGSTVLPHAFRRGLVFGSCPICERRTVFYEEGPTLREHFKCARCGSIPRFRALLHVIQDVAPGWRGLRIHESSPGGASSAKLAAECPGYVASHFYPDVPPGAMRNGVRSENLEAQTFPDGAFDLVVTQDVFEHVLRPADAFREVGRTLRPGGMHVFTVPWYPRQPTRVRAVMEEAGVRFVHPPVYHYNPIDASGSLVVTDWGDDLCEFVFEHSHLSTTVFSVIDRRQGIQAEFNEVFVSRKAVRPRGTARGDGPDQVSHE
ncbi:MAG: class I SAM-dependent methyltransferase [Acidimicrobiia bacterium]|nr:class I SAM-dependent methyltransferase [Acidimicrobiia bacterium]